MNIGNGLLAVGAVIAFLVVGTIFLMGMDKRPGETIAATMLIVVLVGAFMIGATV